VQHLGFKEAMMFRRLVYRRAGIVSLIAFLMCWTLSTSAANNKKDVVANEDVVQSAQSDAEIDVRPMVFDPVLSRAATPTAVVHVSNSSTDQHPTIIPLPPAAWTGMAGLVSLGLIRGRHKLRRFLS
jgi:hypothetical protein